MPIPAFAALVLTLPSEADIAQEIGRDVDPDAIHRAHTEMRRRIGRSCSGHLHRFYEALTDSRPYSPDAASAGRRSLRNASLELLAAADPSAGEALAVAQLRSASNMTDRLASLGVLTTLPGKAREEAIARFGERYRNEPWSSTSGSRCGPPFRRMEPSSRSKTLMEHPGLLDRQSQPRAFADRKLRHAEPGSVQSA